MPFTDDLKKSLEKIEDETLRASLINEVEQAHNLDVQGLKNTRDDLKNEKQTIKTQLETLESSLGGLDGDAIKGLKDKVSEQEKKIKELTDNPEDATKFKELETQYRLQLESAKAETQTMQQKMAESLSEKDSVITQLNNEIDTELAQRELSAQLDAVGVKSTFKPVLLDALANKVHVEQVEGQRKVKIKHEGTSWDLSAGIEQWSKNDINKNFLGAIANAGGGAQGSGGGGKYLNKDFNDLTAAERNDLYKRDPNAFNEMKARAKRR